MLKQLSVLILFASMALTSCQTFELADVDPSTEGSPMGSVKLGKPGKDFFVIPGEPTTPHQLRGQVPVPPSNIVVFKTRERQTHYRALRAIGAPVRGMRKTFSFVVEKAIAIAFFWRKPKQEAAPPAAALAPAMGPIAYPAGVANNEPFARSRSLGAPVGPRSAHIYHTPQINRYGG
jgi:hypothetical protein